MERDKDSRSNPSKKQPSSNDNLSSWKLLKARENFRLKLQMEGLKKTLEEQMRAATILNLIELPPDNMDEDEIFNDRLEYREGELAGNYGRASKEAIEKFYGDSKPVFKYAEIGQGKIQKKVLDVPEILVIPEKTDNLFQLTNDTIMVFPDAECLPDLSTMETHVKLAEIDVAELDFVPNLY